MKIPRLAVCCSLAPFDNFDLNAARECGYRSAFVKRPAEWGPAGPRDPTPNPAHDLIVETFPELADRLGA
jgi:2-haloacid dehalogenase